MTGVSIEKVMDAEGARSSNPSLLQVASFFGRYANLTLGGGSATSAVVHGEIVGKRR
jgi:chromate transport protein ChrA